METAFLFFGIVYFVLGICEMLFLKRYPRV